MRPSRLLLFALAACGSGALTPVDSGAPPPHPPGSVTFHWTFNGGTETCASAGVESVQLYLGLRPLLRAPCLGREGQSLTVDALTESDTSWALTATSALATLTTATGRLPFQPERAQDVTVDLGFDPKTTGAVAFLWTFDHGQSCAQANVETVDVALDGRHVRFACSGVAGERGTLPGLRAGAHPFTLLGLRGGEPVMKKSGQALVTLGKTSELAVDLSRIDPAALGSLTFTWRFEVRSNAGASPLESCAAAQTETVTLQVGDEAPLTVPCLSFEAGHARSIKVPLLPPGALKYTVTGGQRKASGTAVVTAGADQAVDLRLTASSLLSGSVLLEPRFGGQSCTEAGVAQLRVQVGGLITPLDTLVACDALPWRSNGFYPASYPVTLSATGRGGIEYLASGKLMLGGASFAVLPVDLGEPADAGTASAKLDLTFTSAKAACSAAGVQRVRVFVTDEKDALVAGTERSLGCAELPVTLSPLPPGAVFFNVEAVTADGPRYQREVAQTLLTRGAQARLQLGVP